VSPRATAVKTNAATTAQMKHCMARIKCGQAAIGGGNLRVFIQRDESATFLRVERCRPGPAFTGKTGFPEGKILYFGHPPPTDDPTDVSLVMILPRKT
jgi:hypothetical protein